MSNRYRNMFLSRTVKQKNVTHKHSDADINDYEPPKGIKLTLTEIFAKVPKQEPRVIKEGKQPDKKESMSSKYAKAAFETIREEYIKEKENEDLLLEGYERNQMQRDIYNRLVANIYDYINIDFSQHCKESFLKASIATSIYFQKENA